MTGNNMPTKSYLTKLMGTSETLTIQHHVENKCSLKDLMEIFLKIECYEQNITGQKLLHIYKSRFEYTGIYNQKETKRMSGPDLYRVALQLLICCLYISDPNVLILAVHLYVSDNHRLLDWCWGLVCCCCCDLLWGCTADPPPNAYATLVL